MIPLLRTWLAKAAHAHRGSRSPENLAHPLRPISLTGWCGPDFFVHTGIGTTFLRFQEMRVGEVAKWAWWRQIKAPPALA